MADRRVGLRRRRRADPYDTASDESALPVFTAEWGFQPTRFDYPWDTVGTCPQLPTSQLTAEINSGGRRTVDPTQALEVKGRQFKSGRPTW